MNEFLLRFNHNHNGSPLVWRVLINGEEHLASEVNIYVPTKTVQQDINGEAKWHVSCFAQYFRWRDSIIDIGIR